MSNILHCIRATGRRLVVGSAILWLGLNAWHLLEINFTLPLGGDWWHTMETNHPRWITFMAWLNHRAWPWMALILAIVVRQEAHRWFRIRRGRRSADRLLIGWFVFVSTVWMLDQLEPAVTIRWPPVVQETCLWLLTFCAAAWTSRLLHPATRRRLKGVVQRWHIEQLLERILKQAVTKQAEHSMDRPGGRHALPKKLKPRAR